ncbi:MAG: hypothetical protein WBV78_09610, partial [Roseobacter sp.]
MFPIFVLVDSDKKRFHPNQSHAIPASETLNKMIILFEVFLDRARQCRLVFSQENAHDRSAMP